ncbi:LOW QUALITY PROTEIN: tripartite motif-containing protein 43B-like [Trichechus inunguis]
MDSAFQKELTCFICLNYLTDPITTGCGHSFCRPCLCLSWEETETPAHFSLCRETSVQTEFKTNILVKNPVSLVRQASLWQFLSSEEQMCGTHKTKKMCWEEKKSLLTGKHYNPSTLPKVGHSLPLSIHYGMRCIIVTSLILLFMTFFLQVKLLKQMRSLWEKIQENQRNLNKERKIAREWDVSIRLFSIEPTVMHLMRSVHYIGSGIPSSLKKKNNICRDWKVKTKKIFQQLKESEATMGQKRKHLREMYEELMNICHKPDVELLQDLGDILTRSESVQLHMPQPVNPALSGRPITGLIDRFNRFQVEISFNYEISSQNIMLFDDVRSWWLRCDLQEMPFPSGRSNYCAIWGAQVFTSGKHYWEIDVDDSWDWAVGVCNKDSWIRKDCSVIESGDIFLLLCVKEDNHYHLFTTSPMVSLYIGKPLGPVGVSVDFDNDNVGFGYVAKSSLIESCIIPFNYPLRPFFYTGHTRSGRSQEPGNAISEGAFVN